MPRNVQLQTAQRTVPHQTGSILWHRWISCSAFIECPVSSLHGIRRSTEITRNASVRAEEVMSDIGLRVPFMQFGQHPILFALTQSPFLWESVGTIWVVLDPAVDPTQDLFQVGQLIKSQLVRFLLAHPIVKVDHPVGVT